MHQLKAAQIEYLEIAKFLRHPAILHIRQFAR